MYRWVTVAAACRTQSKDGITFALDHMEDLISSANNAAADDGIIATIPVYRHTFLVSQEQLPESSPKDMRAEFYWSADGNEYPEAEELEKLWKEQKKAVRKRWLAVLR